MYSTTRTVCRHVVHRRRREAGDGSRFRQKDPASQKILRGEPPQALFGQQVEGHRGIYSRGPARSRIGCRKEHWLEIRLANLATHAI